MKFLQLKSKTATDQTQQIDEISEDQNDSVKEIRMFHRRRQVCTNNVRRNNRPLLQIAPPLPIGQLRPRRIPVVNRVRNFTPFIVIDDSEQESPDEDPYIAPSLHRPQPTSIPLPLPSCTICQQDIKSLFDSCSLPCLHIFCRSCILQSSKSCNKCPNCRIRYNIIKSTQGDIKIQDTDIPEQEFYFNYETEGCYMCCKNDRPEELLLCDGCEGSFCHVRCDERLQGRVPGREERWVCRACEVREEAEDEEQEQEQQEQEDDYMSQQPLEGQELPQQLSSQPLYAIRHSMRAPSTPIPTPISIPSSSPSNVVWKSISRVIQIDSQNSQLYSEDSVQMISQDPIIICSDDSNSNSEEKAKK